MSFHFPNANIRIVSTVSQSNEILNSSYYPHMHKESINMVHHFFAGRS